MTPSPALATAKRKLLQDIQSFNTQQLSIVIQMLWEICPDALTVSTHTSAHLVDEGHH